MFLKVPRVRRPWISTSWYTRARKPRSAASAAKGSTGRTTWGRTPGATSPEGPKWDSHRYCNFCFNSGEFQEQAERAQAILKAGGTPEDVQNDLSGNLPNGATHAQVTIQVGGGVSFSIFNFNSKASNNQLLTSSKTVAISSCNRVSIFNYSQLLIHIPSFNLRMKWKARVLTLFTVVCSSLIALYKKTSNIFPI